MWKKIKSNRILVDLAGYLCILAAGLFGWLPGPGGTPLLYLGLRLLAVNNPWADRLLNYITTEGSKLLEVVFPDKKLIMLLWDFFTVLLLSTGIYFSFSLSGSYWRFAAYIILVWAFIALLYNRKRYKKVTRQK